MFKNFTLLCGLLLCSLVAFSQNITNQNITFRSKMLFPGQTLANICGWAHNGREYALCGGSKATIFVDVTNPDTIFEVASIPNIDNLWKEIKTYRHYAYVTTEGGGGLQIIDMNTLPAATLPNHKYTGDSLIAGQLGKIHSLHIDTAKGFVYLFGTGGLANGGAVVLDLKPDPYNPKYVGQYNLNYIHDGYVENDTLWGGHILAGYFSVIDFRDKSNPIVLNTQTTPNNFTHNTWLTSDHKTLLTTDERSNSYLVAYDVSDITDIKELSRMQATPGSGSIVHNTHIRNDFAISSWYKDGVNIVDANRPTNLVQVGIYDAFNYPGFGVGDGFEGTWGVYPFLPSGTLVLSNISDSYNGATPDTGALYVLTPTYVRACYLEGKVTEAANGQALNGATIRLVANNLTTNSVITGDYKTGQATAGTFDVLFSKSGFASQIVPATLVNGQVTLLNVALESLGNLTVNTVQSAGGAPIGNAQVILKNATDSVEISTDANGTFVQTGFAPGTYTVWAGAWGYLHKVITNQNIASNSSLTITLEKGYQDDFVFNLGWSETHTATSGFWVRDVPIGTFNQNQLCNTGVDLPNDLGKKCYMTGNGGGNAGDDDVDNGSVTLTSPTMDLTGYANPEIHYTTWFYNGGGQGTAPNDSLIVSLSDGINSLVLEKINSTGGAWRPESKKKVKDFFAVPTNNMRLIFTASDNDPGHLVEAALDAFRVLEGTNSANDLATEPLFLTAQPNPFDEELLVNYDFKDKNTSNIHLGLYNALGQKISTQAPNFAVGNVVFQTAKIPAGIYFVRLEADGKTSEIIKVVKK